MISWKQDDIRQVMADKPLDHVSVSQLRTYLMCGVRWYFQNIVHRGGWEVGDSARLRGSALDTACNAHYKVKAEDLEGSSLSQFVELAVHTHEQGRDTHTFYKLTETESKDRTARIAKEYRTTFGDYLQPLGVSAVQEYVKYQDDGLEVPVHGIIDLRTNSGVVVDNKVKAKKNVPKESAVHRDMQLTTYSMFTGYDKVGLAIVTDERSPEIVYIPSTRTPAQHDLVRHRYNAMVQAIRAGALSPAPEGSWYCNQQWCPFWSECPWGEADEDIPVPGLG